MGSPINIGRVFGVYLRVDIGVFLVAAIFILDGLRQPGLGGVLDEITFVILLFLSIYLHEMGHAFGARMFGIGTLDVTLTFFGGYARLSRQPRTTLEEVVVSFSGPAANLLLAELLASARERVTFLYLIVNAANGRARRFYQRLGFVEFGRDPGGIVVDGTMYEDCLMMLRFDEAAESDE